MKSKNRKIHFAFFLVLLAAGFFGFSRFILAEEGVVIINEVQIYGNLASNDFIELYNPGSAPVSLAGWQLKKRIKTGTESSVRVFPAEATIPARGYFLWANSEGGFNLSVATDVSSTATLSADNSIALFDPENNVRDSLAWGFGHLNPFLEEAAFPINPGTNNSLERKSFQDTDNNFNDFVVNYSPSPRNSAYASETEPEPDENEEEESQEEEENENEEENQEEEENENEEEGEESECAGYPEDIKINEIFPYPDGGNEFAEIANFGKDCVDVSGWKIMDKAGHKKEFPENSILEPEEYLYLEGNLYLNNDSDTVYLLAAGASTAAEALDEVFYEKAKKGYSWSFDGESWYWTIFPTPGRENEFEEVEEDEDENNYEAAEYNIRLNEILPNPKGDEKKGEYIEIFNGEDFKIDLEGWMLKDLSKTKFVFPEDHIIKPGDYLVVYRDVFKFALNNSGKESVYLLDPDENIISSATYEDARENISYNFDGKNWRWSKFLTPGQENKFNSAPKIKIKKIKKAYAGLPVFFSVSAKDSDKDKLKFVWNFGDGKRSYLQEVFHTYSKKGKYSVALSVDDGSEKFTEEFRLEVKSYPSLKVEIIRLLPNPAGLDSGNEYVEIRNNEKKKINLKGWKIATGTENLVNHVIADDFEIEPGKSRRATRENSLFYLNNKAMKLELRYPNGKTADAVSYAKDKIADDEIYEKTAAGWRWIGAPAGADPMQTNDEAPENEENMAQNAAPEIPMELLGGKSHDPSRKNKLQEIINYGFGIKIAHANLGQGPRVLGAEKIKVEKGAYIFTQSSPEDHYAVKFLKNIKARINLLFNKIVIRLMMSS